MAAKAADLLPLILPMKAGGASVCQIGGHDTEVIRLSGSIERVPTRLSVFTPLDGPFPDPHFT